MDTKRLEQIGETFIVSSLLDENILVAKPFFDLLGTDLIGFTSIDDKARFCRIQCKYRELKKSTSVQIDSKYVVGAFVLFLYIKADGKKHFFCLLPNDIKRILKQTSKTKNIYRLSITRKTLQSMEEDKSISFTPKKAAAIFKLMKSSSPDLEFRRMVKGLFKNFKKLSKTQKEYIELSELLHKIEVTELERKALDEKIEILEEYQEIMVKYHNEQNQKV